MQLCRIIVMITISNTLKWVLLQSSEMFKLQFCTEEWINSTVGFLLYLLVVLSHLQSNVALPIEWFPSLIGQLSNSTLFSYL